MIELVLTTIFFGSLIGIGTILFRKIPAVLELPDTGSNLGFKTRVVNTKERIQNLKLSEFPSFEIILQKILSKVRILSLKIEKKTSAWLRKLREKSMKRKENDKYWEELKESIDNEKENNDGDLPT
jgi:hypothetical protein